MPTEAKGNTTVNLSEASKQVQRAKRGIDAGPDIRLEKVRAIREEIQRGEYRIEYDRIAENLLGGFIDEMSADHAVQSKDVLVECVSLVS
jgi:flagellar biosynthesis anti-sigma factor FlgM